MMPEIVAKFNFLQEWQWKTYSNLSTTTGAIASALPSSLASLAHNAIKTKRMSTTYTRMFLPWRAHRSFSIYDVYHTESVLQTSYLIHAANQNKALCKTYEWCFGSTLYVTRRQKWVNWCVCVLPSSPTTGFSSLGSLRPDSHFTKLTGKKSVCVPHKLWRKKLYLFFPTYWKKNVNLIAVNGICSTFHCAATLNFYYFSALAEMVKYSGRTKKLTKNGQFRIVESERSESFKLFKS